MIEGLILAQAITGTLRCLQWEDLEKCRVYGTGAMETIVTPIRPPPCPPGYEMVLRDYRYYACARSGDMVDPNGLNTPTFTSGSDNLGCSICTTAKVICSNGILPSFVFKTIIAHAADPHLTILDCAAVVWQMPKPPK